jgi:hypothetical protein
MRVHAGITFLLVQVECSKLEPWEGTFGECVWSGLVDTRGIEDPKLFVWPGKGVYAMFGRKPELAQDAASPLCPKDQPWLQQYLMLLIPARQPPAHGTAVMTTTANEDPWMLKKPVPLRVSIPGALT